jgi:predicted nucleotidyltransferase
MVYYQANVDSPLFPDLQSLFVKTAGLANVLTDTLKPLAPKVDVAFVYGSIARGSERHDSDIDLMLIGNVSPVELAQPLRQARELLGRAINPTVYTPQEFRKKQKAKDHFLTAVLDKPKIFVIGNRHELGKISRP